ncbi:occludin/ELL domain-containing protein 1 [Pangshura tecta]
MANSAPSREKRRPIVESDGDPLNSSWQMWPLQAWTRASGRSYPGKSDVSDSFDSSTPEPPLPAQPPVGDVPRSSETQEASPLKPVRRFIPLSWKNFFQRWRREPEPFLPLAYATARRSPPVSPLSDRRGPARKGSSSSGFQEPSWSSPSECNQETEMSPARSQQGQAALPSYEEKLEAYNLKYSYMKSWPGLLRLMAGLELVFGGMVFACVCAYIQKDYQWYNLYGGSLLSGGLLGGGYGYNYYGPMTPFVLVVASLAWLVTVILLGLGVTMYYRTILLNSHWWPLTEFALNVIMFLLYMGAAIAYVNDVNRGSLCYSLFASNPLIAAFCRVEGGQVAAIAFLFITTLLYLAGALVCLKMWRHEMARKQREGFEALVSPQSRRRQLPSASAPFPAPKARRLLLALGRIRPVQVPPRFQGYRGRVALVHQRPEGGPTASPGPPSGAVTLLLSLTPLCLFKHNPVLRQARPKRIVFQDEVMPSGSLPGKVTKQLGFSEEGEASGALSCSIPTGHTPKPHVVPDYVVKYPGICCHEEREKYKAVFNDQYAEYKELYHEVHAALQKFKELDAMMSRLPHRTPSKTCWQEDQGCGDRQGTRQELKQFARRERCQFRTEKCLQIFWPKEFPLPASSAAEPGLPGLLPAAAQQSSARPLHSLLYAPQEQSRVSNIWKEYRQKKRDPAFLEKQERCDYLKKKLAHIKAQIQAYDRTAKEGSMYF